MYRGHKFKDCVYKRDKNLINQRIIDDKKMNYSIEEYLTYSSLIQLRSILIYPYNINEKYFRALYRKGSSKS